MAHGSCPRCGSILDLPAYDCPACALDLRRRAGGDGGPALAATPVVGRDPIPPVQLTARVAGAVALLSATVIGMDADPPWVLVDSGLGLLAIWGAYRICRYGFRRGVFGLASIFRATMRPPGDR